MNLDLIALNNLFILSDIDNENDFLNITDKIKFKTDKKDESFKNIVELSGLEYAIHFTFHHIFTLFEIQKTNEKRRYIIDKMIFLIKSYNKDVLNYDLNEIKNSIKYNIKNTNIENIDSLDLSYVHINDLFPT